MSCLGQAMMRAAKRCERARGLAIRGLDHREGGYGIQLAI